MRKRIILLARGYNDVDCRLPLLLEFARDSRYKVEIIGIPSNSGIQDPRKHELGSYLIKNGIEISTIYDLARGKRLLKAAVRVYGFWDRTLRSGSAVGERFKALIFRIVFLLSTRRKDWMIEILKGFDSSVVVMDEIAFHARRSFFVDELLRSDRSSFSIYSFLAGQDPYLNLWHDRGDAARPRADRVGVPLFVPGPNDKTVMEKTLPLETIEVVGNTRFDFSWVQTLSDLARRNLQKQAALREPAGRRIVFMLSKIEYGVDLGNIIEAMNACAAVHGARIIVKPHTRGMSISPVKAGLDKRVVDGSRYSSSDLIEWADTVMFTGSSISFQAIQLGKKVVFLKYCQRYQSIFDESGAVFVADGKADVLRLVELGGSLGPGAIASLLSRHVYNGDPSGRVCRAVKERIEKMEQALAYAS